MIAVIAISPRDIPFVFLTGSDPNVIPKDLADVTRLQKPAELRQVVGSEVLAARATATSYTEMVGS